MATVKRVNESGIKALKEWITATALPDHCSVDSPALDAWCNEAEESANSGIGMGAYVEMSQHHSISGYPEIFCILESGMYEQDIEE
jgi:hypothetical protein